MAFCDVEEIYHVAVMIKEVSKSRLMTIDEKILFLATLYSTALTHLVKISSKLSSFGVVAFALAACFCMLS